MAIEPFPLSDRSQIQEDVNKEILRTLQINQLDIDQRQFAFLKNTGTEWGGILPEVQKPDDRQGVFTRYGVPPRLRDNTKVSESATTSTAESNDKLKAADAEKLIFTQMRIDDAHGRTVARGYSKHLQTANDAKERVLLSTVDESGVNTVVVTDNTYDREGRRTGTAKLTIKVDYKNKTLETTRTVNGREESTSTIDISSTMGDLSNVAERLAKAMPPLPSSGLLAKTDMPPQFKPTAGGPSMATSRDNVPPLPT